MGEISRFGKAIFITSFGDFYRFWLILFCPFFFFLLIYKNLLLLFILVSLLVILKPP